MPAWPGRHRTDSIPAVQPVQNRPANHADRVFPESPSVPEFQLLPPLEVPMAPVVPLFPSVPPPQLPEVLDLLHIHGLPWVLKVHSVQVVQAIRGSLEVQSLLGLQDHRLVLLAPLYRSCLVPPCLLGQGDLPDRRLVQTGDLAKRKRRFLASHPRYIPVRVFQLFR